MKFEEPSTTERKIGLALSGGGSRAIAFHLGCLRALHKLGILERISGLSCVSGGSVIGSYLFVHEGDFDSFDQDVRNFLSAGIVGSMLRRLASYDGLKVIAAFLTTALAGFAVACLRAFGALLRIFPGTQRFGLALRAVHSPLRRFASRTTLLELVLNDKLFKGRRLTELPTHPNLIINATELRTGSAFRFGVRESGSWRFGRAKPNSVSIAHAVAASAAYPLFLPAFDEIMKFEKDGLEQQARVILTDGGVYDNLGVSCFWPDRAPDVSLNVDSIDTIICCSAGYGLREEPPSQFLIARLMSTFSATSDRAQNASFQRLYDLQKSGAIKRFALPYLGQQDSRVPNPPSNLVKREEAHAYPTDFNAMPDDWIDRLSLRGEQLTMCLIREYMPDLIRQNENDN